MTLPESSSSDRAEVLFAALPDVVPLAATVEFVDSIKRHQIVLDSGDEQQLGRFLGMLRHVNEHINLTAVTDPEAMWTRHVLDSLTLLPLIAQHEAAQVIDVGAGGGLPGIPLAITMPTVQFTLLEATGKKARFLRRCIDALALTNATVIDDRAENIGRDRVNHRERYDLVVARGVGRLPVLLELTVPLARIGGLVLAIKGERAGEEIESARPALHLLHSHVIDTVSTPTGTVVVIEKQRRTPKLYPRRPGEPKRAPLS